MSISLYYQANLPASCDSDFEVTGEHWADNGTHAFTRTTTAAQIRTGVGAGVLTAGGAGDYATNNVSLAATYMPTVIAAQTWKIRFYAKASAGTPSITMANAGDNTGDTTALNASTWTLCEWDFTAAAGDAAGHILKLWASAAATIYFDDLQLIRTLTFSTPLMVRGIDDADEIEVFPDVCQKLLDGNYYRRDVKVFNRRITIDLGVVQTKADRVFLVNFAYNSRYCAVYYGTEEIEVVIPDLSQFGNVWDYNFKSAKHYSLNLIEKTGRTAIPSSWLS